MIFVVGSKGWIGSEVCRLLIDTKTDFVGVGRSEIEQDSFWESIGRTHFRQSPAILNLASPGLTAESQKSYETTTKKIAHWVKALNARSIHIGSAAEFGDVEHLISEETPIRPVTPYGVLKARASEIALNSGACMLRPFNVFGKDQPITTPVGEWVQTIKRFPQEGGVLRLLNGSLERDFVSLPFVARVITHFCLSNTNIGSLNICTGNGILFSDMAQHLVSASGKKISIDDACTGGIPKVIGNPYKLNTLGFSEDYAVEQIARLSYEI
jgi:nucleoside-diphosphate-sugar epimerase